MCKFSKEKEITICLQCIMLIPVTIFLLEKNYVNRTIDFGYIHDMAIDQIY